MVPEVPSITRCFVSVRVCVRDRSCVFVRLWMRARDCMQRCVIICMYMTCIYPCPHSLTLPNLIKRADDAFHVSRHLLQTAHELLAQIKTPGRYHPARRVHFTSPYRVASLLEATQHSASHPTQVCTWYVVPISPTVIACASVRACAGLIWRPAASGIAIVVC